MENTTSIPWDLIAQKLAKLGKRPAWLAVQLGTGTNTITNWKRRGGAPIDRAKALSDILKCSADELLGTSSVVSAKTHMDVKDQMPLLQGATKNGVMPSAGAYNVPHAGENFDLGPDIKPRRYPEISWIQAGMWSDLCENFQPDEHTDWHTCHIDLGPCGFVVTVRGPSMTAPVGAPYSFPEGIKLFVSPDAEALPGKFVIVARDGKATFKKLSQVDSELYLEALNPEWHERYQRVQEDDRFIGVVRHAGFDL
jgi:SOS-response transcriptional repressor LexA